MKKEKKEEKRDPDSFFLSFFFAGGIFGRVKYTINFSCSMMR